MYPNTYYRVLMPEYSETGQVERKTDRDSGRSYELRWQRINWLVIGTAESMADAKLKYPWLRNPVLEPVGFTPRDTSEPLRRSYEVRTFAQLLSEE